VRSFFENHQIGSVSALEWALKNGNTTREGRGPGGLGLSEMKALVHLNRGAIQIVSRRAFYEFRNNTERFSTMEYDFPGTAVTLEFNTDDPTEYALQDEYRQSDT